jgi:hypothetical protein
MFWKVHGTIKVSELMITKKKVSFFLSYALFAPFPFQFLSYKHPSCLNDRQMEAQPNEKSTNNIVTCLKKIMA